MIKECDKHKNCDKECKHDTFAIPDNPTFNGNSVEARCEHCNHRLLLIKTDPSK